MVEVTHSPTLYTSTSKSYSYAVTARPGNRSRGRPATRRPRTAASTITKLEDHHIICAISESRGVSPTVGLAFVNLTTTEAVLCQICDSQTYVRTMHKLLVYAPSEILIMSTATNPKSKLYSIIEENLDALGSRVVLLDRRYWAENTGLDYIQNLSFVEDIEAIKVSIGGNFFAVCCIAAVGQRLTC